MNVDTEVSFVSAEQFPIPSKYGGKGKGSAFPYPIFYAPYFSLTSMRSIDFYTPAI